MCWLSRKTRCDEIRGYVMESTIQTFRKRGNAQLRKSMGIVALVGYRTLNVVAVSDIFSLVLIMEDSVETRHLFILSFLK